MIMTKLFHSILFSALLAGAAVTAAQAADAISERTDGFKANKHSVAAIKDAIASGNAAAIADKAKSIATFAARIPSLFPPGSTSEDSAAKDDIWSNFPDFTAKAQTLQTNAQALADLAASGKADQDQLQAGFGKVLDSCKACHRQYKEDK